MLCTLGNPNIANLFNYGTCLITKSIIPIIFSIAVVVFVWGVVKFFIIDADEEAKRTQGKQFMIWGIIAIAVTISVWGLVRILGRTFVPGVNTQLLPGVRPRGSSQGTGGAGSSEDFIPGDESTGGGGGGGAGGVGQDPYDPCPPFFTMCDSTNLPP